MKHCSEHLSAVSNSPTVCSAIGPLIEVQRVSSWRRSAHGGLGGGGLGGGLGGGGLGGGGLGGGGEGGVDGGDDGGWLGGEIGGESGGIGGDCGVGAAQMHSQ